MAKGYWMFHVTVNDPDTYQKYIDHDAPVFAKYGGRFLARGGAFQALEGSARQRHVIIEFDSYETALAYYHSSDYQAAAEFRRRSAIADLVIVKGVD